MTSHNTKKRFFECPHCKRDYPCNNLKEAEQHIKECPSQFTDPQKQFDARKKIYKSKEK